MVECLRTWKGPHCLIGAHLPVLGDILGLFWANPQKWPQHMPPPWPKVVEKGPFQLHITCQKGHGRMPEDLEGLGCLALLIGAHSPVLGDTSGIFWAIS